MNSLEIILHQLIIHRTIPLLRQINLPLDALLCASGAEADQRSD